MYNVKLGLQNTILRNMTLSIAKSIYIQDCTGIFPYIPVHKVT